MDEQASDDASLTHKVRVGDSHAAAELYRRHHPAVLAFALRLCRDPQAAEDLASEAFVRTLRTVRSGTAGPQGTWRPYLYAVVRNTAAEWARADQRLILTDEFQEDALTIAGPEPSDDLVGRAYRSLPPRWQSVLWHTLIEEDKPEQVAEILGVTPGNVGVLAFRAREGLRKAYLAAHITSTSPGCRDFAEPLAAAVRKRKARLPRALRKHLDSCQSCARAYSALIDLNSTLRAGLPIMVLPLGMEALGKAKSASTSALGWAIPAVVATAGIGATAAIVLNLPPEPAPQSRAATPIMTSPTPTPSRQTPTQATPKRTAKPPPKPTPTAVAGTRIGYAGRCVGTVGSRIAALPCADPRTAWRIKGEAHQFNLVNVVGKRCLAAGEKYDTAAFNGGGMRAVRLASCSGDRAQRWHTPTFSDSVPRLVNVSSGMALSIGKEYAGKRPPTAFILYGAYTGSLHQRIILTRSSG